MPSGPVAAIASARPLRWLGGISYALYLVHWPVIVVADRLTDSRSLARSAVIVAISLCPRPAQRRRRRTSRPAAVTSPARPLASARAAVACDRRCRRRRRRPGHAVGRVARRPVGGRGDGDAATASLRRRLGAPRVAMFGDSVGFSLLLALGDTTVTPQFDRAPSEVEPRVRDRPVAVAARGSARRCDDPAERFAAKARRTMRLGAVMISCQWELLAQPLPGRGDEQYVIGHPAFDAYVRLRYEDVANQLTAAGVDRILWMTCPYLSYVGRVSTGCHRVSSTAATRLASTGSTRSSRRWRPTAPTSTCWRSASGSTSGSTTPPSAPTAPTTSTAATTQPPTPSSSTSTLRFRTAPV